MKQAFLALGFAAFATSFAAPVLAAEDYFIEVGGESPKDEADKEWASMAATYKSQLGKLKYFPKSVIHGGSDVGTRIQAGPIDNKARAHAICARLFKDKIPCFVIEGVGSGTPPSAMATLAEFNRPKAKFVRLPWQADSDVPIPVMEPPLVVEQEIQQPAPVEQVADTTPVIAETSAPIASPPPAPEAPVAADEYTVSVPEKGDVEVAEAIRVPLSSETQPGNSELLAKSMAPVPSNAFHADEEPSYDKRASATASSGTGWLLVSSFPNDDIALSFWEEVRASNPERANSLRVRVLRPLMGRGEPKTVMNIGPFASSSDALEFCHGDLQARERGLTCNFGARDPSSTVMSNVANAPTRNTFFGQKSGNTSFATRRAPTENPVVPNSLAKQYWVQLLDGPTQMDVLRQWDLVRSQQADLVKKTRASVSPSTTGSGYAMRAGPFVSSDEATGLCSALQGRDIPCRVLLFSNP